jgi:hypothetical protein
LDHLSFGQFFFKVLQIKRHSLPVANCIITLIWIKINFGLFKNTINAFLSVFFQEVGKILPTVTLKENMKLLWPDVLKF